MLPSPGYPNPRFPPGRGYPGQSTNKEAPTRDCPRVQLEPGRYECVLRHFGLLANRNRRQTLTLCRLHLSPAPAADPSSLLTEQPKSPLSRLCPSAKAAHCTSSRAIRRLNRPAPAQRFTAQPSTLPEETMRSSLSTRLLTSTASDLALAPLCSNRLRTVYDRHPAACQRRNGSAIPLRHGQLRPPSCPLRRLSSPQALFLPHTSTALAAYFKSPYPHCSAPALPPAQASLHEEHCRYGAIDSASIQNHSCREGVDRY